MRAKIFAFWIISFIVGTMAASYFSSDPKLHLFLAVGLFIAAFAVFGNRFPWSVICAISFFLFAVALSQFQSQDYLAQNNAVKNQKVNSTVTVADIPVETDRGQQVAVTNDKHRYLAYLKAFPVVKYGQKLKITATAKEYAPERVGSLIKSKLAAEITVSEFSVVGEDKSLTTRIKGGLFGLRQNFNEKLQQLLPKEEAGLASGLILGEKAAIPPDLKRALQATGTTHIIALSGYNITIILALFVFLRKKGSRRMNIVLPLIFIVFFVIMTGASASVVRASIMGSMPLFARYFGRPSNSIMAVLFSAFLMIALNPYILLFDPGFQLSFAAMIGLIFLTPLFNNLFKVKSISGQILAETMGAQIAVLPLIIYYFGVVSFISPLTNLIILALVPWAMLLAFLVGFAGMILLPIGSLVALPSYYIFKFINGTIYYFGNLPFASSQFTINLWGVAIYYLIFADIIFIFNGRIKQTEV